MADYRATSTEFTAVADAIRTKGGTSAQLTWPNGFVSAVQAIPTSGGVIQALNAQQNGTYNPPSGVDGFAPVVVDVSGGSSSPWNEQFCVNWDFTNPINTREQTEYSTTGTLPTIDGWLAVSNTTVKLTNQGITLSRYSGSSTGLFVQGIINSFAYRMEGKVMTFSVIVDDALFSVTDTIASGGYGSHGLNPGFSDLFFRIYHYMSSSSGGWANILGITVDIKGGDASSHVLKAMKLEIGNQQTLATMVGGVPVLNKSMVIDEESIKLGSVRNS